VPYGCKLADAALNLFIGVEAVLGSTQGSWFIASVALWRTLCWSTWAVSAGFRLRARVRFSHSGNYAHAADSSGCLSS